MLRNLIWDCQFETRRLNPVLFVTRVLADDAHHVLAPHNLAAFAQAFDGGSDFHRTVCGFGVSVLWRNVMRPLVRS